MKQNIDRFYVWGFLSLLTIMSLLLFMLPIQTFSDIENRSLQKQPKLTWESIWSKQFMQESEIFITDHFPFRNQWVWTKSTLEQLRLQQENNGIYRGKEGYLFEKFLEPDYAKLEQYTNAMKQFATSHPDANMTFLLAPNSIGIYPELLPWLAPAYPQQKVNEWVAKQLKGDMTFLDGFNIFSSHKDDDKPLYYKTDHHWTTYGAYLAYKAYASEQNWNALEIDEFNIRTVSNAFLGSFHSRSLFSGLTPDSIEVFEPIKPLQTTVYIADTNETLTTMYDHSALNKKDKYTYFLGGVHALMTMTTDHGEQAPDKEKLLVIKDSYAHNMLPFLTQHVSEIHVIDVRFYNGSIKEYMENNDIKDVLLLFNTSTFTNEQSLLKLKH